jgi:hypothetical protein
MDYFQYGLPEEVLVSDIKITRNSGVFPRRIYKTAPQKSRNVDDLKLLKEKRNPAPVKWIVRDGVPVDQAMSTIDGGQADET